jgi:hypothetical protein
MNSHKALSSFLALIQLMINEPEPIRFKIDLNRKHTSLPAYGERGASIGR